MKGVAGAKKDFVVRLNNDLGGKEQLGARRRRLNLAVGAKRTVGRSIGVVSHQHFGIRGGGRVHALRQKTQLGVLSSRFDYVAPLLLVFLIADRDFAA